MTKRRGCIILEIDTIYPVSVEHGHGATFAARLSNGMLTINHAAGKEEGILSEDITYEELCRRFEYIAWPAGLGTLEENPTLWRVRDELDDFYE